MRITQIKHYETKRQICLELTALSLLTGYPRNPQSSIPPDPHPITSDQPSVTLVQSPLTVVQTPLAGLKSHFILYIQLNGNSLLSVWHPYG